jgi:hypothetical protein
MKRVLIIAVLLVTAAAAPGFRYVAQELGCVCETAGAVASPLFWHLANEILPYAIARGASQDGCTVTDEAKWRAAFAAGDLLYAVLPQLLRPGLARPASRVEAKIISETCRFELVSFVVR